MFSLWNSTSWFQTIGLTCQIFEGSWCYKVGEILTWFCKVMLDSTTILEGLPLTVKKKRTTVNQHIYLKRLRTLMQWQPKEKVVKALFLMAKMWYMKKGRMAIEKKKSGEENKQEQGRKQTVVWKSHQTWIGTVEKMVLQQIIGGEFCACYWCLHHWNHQMVVHTQ